MPEAQNSDYAPGGWRESEITFLKAHPNADDIIADKSGRVIAAIYVSPYGTTMRSLREFLAMVGKAPEEEA